MPTINLRSFKQTIRFNKRRLRSFLSRLEKNRPRGLDQKIGIINDQVWKEVNCLDCANCCKTMTPTYTAEDVKRISKYLGMTERSFREKWLYKDRSGDWINQKLPCQFLNLKTNMCSIYPVRPRDCSGFPHHVKRKIPEYGLMYKQNIEYCPATHKLIEDLMSQVELK
jgi:Fe-S-cluster containining protein